MKPPVRSSRPLSVTLLALLVFYLAAANLLRLAQAVAQWQFLEGLLPFSPLYLALSGLVWGIAGLPLAGGLWLGKAWAPRWTRLAFLAFSLYFWLDRLLLEGYTERNVNWPFAACVNLALLAGCFWILSRKKASAFFGGVHEQ